MSNNFYTSTSNPLPDTLIRSASQRNEMAAVEVGFDRVETKTNAAIKAPDGETLTALPAAATRANKAMVFDATGQVALTVTASTAEMDAAVVAAAQVALDAAQVTADVATVAGAINTLNLLQLLNGVR